MSLMHTKDFVSSPSRLPSWFRQELPHPYRMSVMRKLLKERHLHTVCESAHCPNIGQCWKHGVATFMILGDICTRGCRFCAVKGGTPSCVDPREPERVAETVKALGLGYVVVTSVTRDDLEDHGASHYVKTIRAIRRFRPETKIELLIPDFLHRERFLAALWEAHPDVIGHNMETVHRLYHGVRSKADYKKSLQLLRRVARSDSGVFVKSGFMVGLGETYSEVLELMQDLKKNGCQILTIGQYLAPSRSSRYRPVDRFYTPDEFVHLREVGVRMGFQHVMSGPLVRSSYFAHRGYEECLSAPSGCRGK